MNEPRSDLVSRITWPVNGSAGVPTSGLTVNWQAEAATTGFHVILEQNENDGLSVFLPADARSLQIPDGVLAKGTRTLLEIATLAENGNRTVVEVRFETR